MAISSSRISNKNIIKLITKDFISPTDRTKDTPSNVADSISNLSSLTSKLASKIGKDNIFDTNKTNDASDTLISIGIYPENGNPACSTKPDKSKTNPDDRDLNNAGNSNNNNNQNEKCENANPVDISILADNVIENIENGVPEFVVKSLEDSIEDQLQDLTNITDKVTIIDKKTGIIAGVNKVKKGLSEVGLPIPAKLDLKKLLSCPKSNGISPGDNDTLLGIGIEILLNNAICISPENMVDAIIDIATDGDVDKGNILKGIVNNLNGIGDKSAEDKIKVLAATASGLGGLKPSDASKTKGLGKKLLDSLANNKPSKKAPSEEHENMLSSLEILDPDWAKDESGNTSVGLAKENLYLTELSSRKLKTRSKPADSISLVADEDEDEFDFLSKAIIAANATKPVKGDNSIPIPGF